MTRDVFVIVFAPMRWEVPKDNRGVQATCCRHWHRFAQSCPISPRSRRFDNENYALSAAVMLETWQILSIQKLFGIFGIIDFGTKMWRSWSTDPWTRNRRNRTRRFAGASICFLGFPRDIRNSINVDDPVKTISDSPHNYGTSELHGLDDTNRPVETIRELMRLQNDQ